MSHNGHNPNDAIAARIVAGAIQADKKPPAAARAVRRALTAVGEAPPPAKEDRTPVAAAAGEAVSGIMQAQLDRLARLAQLAAERVGRQQDGLELADSVTLDPH